MLTRVLRKLENFLFQHRKLVLILLVVFTVVMAVFGSRLRMDAGYDKQMPIGHEYIQTFEKYRLQLFGANRLTIAVKARHGTIWNREALSRLYAVTQAVVYNLPNVDRLGVQSLWTPNSYVNSITAEGFKAEPLIAGTITPEQLTPETIAEIERLTIAGGFVGTLVSKDQTSALITAELAETDLNGKKLDYIAYNHLLENDIRKRFEDDKYEIQMIGFAKQIGDIADGASAVVKYCALALLTTALAVYWYCRSVRLTILPVLCSLTSLVWQFGTLSLLGYGLDPLAVLVPFLVFAIGVSHGIQQINFIVREIAHGKTTEQAARASFSGLLIPGTLALATAFLSFITLLLIKIPMVRELAITASIGVGFKIITNLIVLPVAASFFNFSDAFAEKSMLKRERRSNWLRVLARVAEPRNAVIITCITGLVFALSVWNSRDRVVGTLQPGAPELRAESRFNQDARAISSGYDMGLDWLTVVMESPADSNACSNIALGRLTDDLSWGLQNVPGVAAVSSFTSMMRTYSEGYNEGYPKMAVVPIDPTNFAAQAIELTRIRGYVNSDCSMVAAHAFLSDHKATTITRVVNAVKEFRKNNVVPSVTIRLASGNAGVLAATNEVLEKSELPMMLWVYAAITVLVFLAYRDLRAVIACCLPLTVATFIGYWFMKELQIGLTVATLPVMVLAVGIGVDYAFYIYNRLQLHLSKGLNIVKALEYSILEVGVATIFTAVTLAAGVAIWSFSALKFQADMGKLLAFMFMVNLVMAMTALPALAVVLERIFPRRGPVRVPGLMNH